MLYTVLAPKNKGYTVKDAEARRKRFRELLTDYLVLEGVSSLFIAHYTSKKNIHVPFDMPAILSSFTRKTGSGKRKAVY